MIATRFLFFLGFLMISGLCAAQQITIKAPNCTDGLFEYKFNGVNFVKKGALQSSGADTYTLSNQVERTGITYIGNGKGSTIPLVLDGKESFNITGNCNNLAKAITTGSAVNDSYSKLKRQFQQLNKEGQDLMRTLRVSPAKTPAHEKVKSKLLDNDKAKLELLSSLQESKNDFFASMVAINSYTSFENTAKPYANELEYFVNERFQYADFSDAIFKNNPWVFEGYRDFARTLVQSKAPDPVLDESLTTALSLIVNNKEAHKLALGGVIAILKEANKPLTVKYAKTYIKNYGESEPEAASLLEKTIQRLGALADGAVAPTFTQLSIDSSEQIGPEQFRGKVLLIDFWASWCGPCRRENPNVVKMYNKHKASGFDILGVSLDKQHDRWVKAVEKDKLTWSHVSDLKGWANSAARLYGVRSIPATVLLDKEGRIVARNLRGKALEAKVAELLEKG